MFKRLQLFLKTNLQLEGNTALGSTLGISKAGGCLEKQTGVCGKTVFPPPNLAYTTAPEKGRLMLLQNAGQGSQGRDPRAEAGLTYAEVTNRALSSLPHPLSPLAAAAVTQG